MRSRLEDIPVFSTKSTLVDAACFNRVRLALLRIGNPLRMQLAGLRELDIQLEDDAWICVDRTLNDIPVIAWLDFACHERTALHEPIACTLNMYHAHAGMITDQVLEVMSVQLAERLRPDN